ncbi:hypothetical protein B0H19DRAFT_1380092 [Mycena capillaripes]|nr:hypothetical protein B0H19DRAFT_1380092 [Mycena capillaripes]
MICRLILGHDMIISTFSSCSWLRSSIFYEKPALCSCAVENLSASFHSFIMRILLLTFFTGQLALSSAGLLKYRNISQDAGKDFVPSASSVSPPEATFTQLAGTQISPVHETPSNDRISADNFAVSRTVLPVARAMGTAAFGTTTGIFARAGGFGGLGSSSDTSTFSASNTITDPPPFFSASSASSTSQPTHPLPPPPQPPPPPSPPPRSTQSTTHPPPAPPPTPSSHPTPVSSASQSLLSQLASSRSSPVQIVGSIVIGSTTTNAGLPSASSPTSSTSPGNPISSSPSTISASTGSKHTWVLVGVLIPVLIILLVAAIIIHRRRRRHPHRAFDTAEADSQATDVAASETLRDATSDKDSRNELQARNNSDVQAAPSEKNSAPEPGLQFIHADPYDNPTPRNRYSLSRAPTFVSGDWPGTPLPRYTRPLPKIPLT